MTDNPDPRAEKATAVPISDAPHAPFIFYEAAPLLGLTNGVVNITLTANRTYAGPYGTILYKPLLDHVTAIADRIVKPDMLSVLLSQDTARHSLGILPYGLF